MKIIDSPGRFDSLIRARRQVLGMTQRDLALAVNVGERFITIAGDGPSFAYDPRWPKTRRAFPVSLRMPLGGGLFDAATRRVP